MILPYSELGLRRDCFLPEPYYFNELVQLSQQRRYGLASNKTASKGAARDPPLNAVTNSYPTLNIRVNAPLCAVTTVYKSHELALTT